MHGQNTFVDAETNPGGLLLFDSTLHHEVLSPDGATRASDDKGRHAPHRISIVFMANIETHNYQTPEIYHGVADIAADSLALAIEASKTKADKLIMCGVHQIQLFMMLILLLLGS